MLSDLLTGTDLGFDQRRFLQQVAANADSWLVKILIYDYYYSFLNGTFIALFLRLKFIMGDRIKRM